MRKSRSGAYIKYDHFPEYQKEVPKALDEFLRTSAIEVQTRTMQNLRAVNAIDTGNLVNSIYTRFYNENNRPGSLLISGKHFSSKQGKYIYPRGDALATPPETPTRFEAWIGAAAVYAMFVEFGTVNMRARPYLTPAGLSVKREAPRMMGVILARHFGKIG